MTELRRPDQAHTESDEAEHQEDNSLGRLLTLSDGIFAIAMTLLVFDLKIPDLGAHPDSTALRHALAKGDSGYLSFVVSFYVVGGYWQRHRVLMRSVVRSHQRLVRKTLFLLLIVASMPFLSSLLGEYGGTPIALSLYGFFNAVAVLTLLQIGRDVRRFELAADRVPGAGSSLRRDRAQFLLVFLLCIPAGFVLGRHGPVVLALLAVPVRVPPWLKRGPGAGLRRRQAVPGASRPSS